MKRQRSLSMLAAVIPFALVLSACTVNDSAVNQSDDSSEEGWALPADSVEALEEQPDLSAMVPDEFKENGIIVGNDGESLPLSTEEDGVRRGLDGDLSRAVGAVLGAPIKNIEVDFDGLIPGLKANRMDMISSGMADYTERQVEIDFVDYFESAISLLVAEDNPLKIESLDDLCGIRVATLRGSGAANAIETQSEKCVTEGGEAIEISAFPDTPAATNQLMTGRADAVTNDFPLAVYSAQTLRDGTAVDLVDTPLYGGFFYGFGLSKDDPELRDAVQGAMQYLIDSGWYGDLLESYGLEDGAIETAKVNGGGDRPFSS